MKLLKLLTIFSLCIATAQKCALPKKTLEFVSLGKDCEVSFSLRDLKLRSHAYPFDWLLTEDFESICLLMENNFEDFLNPQYLQLEPRRVVNTRYNIIFNHDFPRQGSNDAATGFQNSQLFIVENYLDYLDEITQKYKRRIERLIKLLNGETKVIFIKTYLTPTQAQRFTTMMAKHYPSADYVLLGLHQNPVFNCYWGIPHVVTVYMSNLDHEQWRADIGWFERADWKKVFTDFGFINAE